MTEFLDKNTKMPRFKNGFNPEYVHVIFDATLKNTADSIGLPARTFTRTHKEPDLGANGIQKLDEKGKPKYVKVETPQTTTSIFCRAFRCSWESWLMTVSGRDDFAMFKILKSIVHTQETAMCYYLVSEFDDKDISDMIKATEGFGSFKKEE